MAIPVYEIWKYESTWPDNYDCANVPTATVLTISGEVTVNTSYRCTFSPTVFVGFATALGGLSGGLQSSFLGYVDSDDSSLASQSGLMGNLVGMQGLSDSQRQAITDSIGQGNLNASSGTGSRWVATSGGFGDSTTNLADEFSEVRNVGADQIVQFGTALALIGGFVGLLTGGLSLLVTVTILAGVGAIGVGNAIRYGEGNGNPGNGPSQFEKLAQKNELISSDEDDRAFLDAVEEAADTAGASAADLKGILTFVTVQSEAADFYAVFTGDEAAEGTQERDIVSGYFGNDVIRTKGGNDDIFAGFGADQVKAGSGDDRVVVGSGADTVYAGGGSDFIDAGKGRDKVYGGNGKDDINGGNGADDLYGGNGHDLVKGKGGADLLRGGDGNDRVWGGNGKDKVYLGKGNDVFYDNAQNDQNGDDTVFGGKGNDTFNIGGGKNVLTGGAGADKFLFNATQTLGENRVTDFIRGTDILEISGATFADLNFVATGSGVRVEWDEGSVKLDNVNVVSEDDFIFV